ncbi:MAG: saccharopine dehydrogenase, partial [Actinomycetota bacterium]|nr:saccharopine dehydrogenase [Actinomycetota bacterium]
DYVPGNLAGALVLRLADGMVHRVEIGYLITGVGRAQVFSRGTFASLIGVATAQAFTWRDGIHAEPAGSRMRTFPLDGVDRPAMTIGSTEHYALPRLAEPRGLPEVDVYLGWFGSATRALHLSSRLTPVLLQLPGARSLVRRIGEFAQRRVAEEPDPVALARVVPHFIGTAYDASGTALAEVHLASGEPYQLTADLLAWGAQRAAEDGVSRPGALGPVEAFGLNGLETAAIEVGLRRL